MGNGIMKFILGLIILLSISITACTNTSTLIASTAMDVKTTLKDYPELSDKVSKLKLSKEDSKKFKVLIVRLDNSYNYFSSVTPLDVDIDEVESNFISARTAYLALRELLISSNKLDSNEALKVELLAFDKKMIRIHQNIYTILERKNITSEDLKTIENVVKSVSVLVSLL